MKKNNPFIVGTIVLTATGFASRIIGFFYRIFLSRTFGEEGMGIYQLIAPVMALVFSLSVAGIQTSISKFVASETSTKNYKFSFHILFVGFTISVGISVLCSLLIYQGSDYIAANLIFETRTAPLLRILALSFPFSTIHSCINGYYFGIRKTKIPAITQITEQIARVSCVYLLYQISITHHYKLTISCAVIGLVVGEFLSMIISLVSIYFRFYHVRKSLCLPNKYQLKDNSKKILLLAIPLSANRIVINFLQSVEAVYIPKRLFLSGLTISDSLRVYGVLTGMALPLILFPSAITNSVSVLLLPLVSEAESNHNYGKIQRAVRKSITYCLLLGFLCTAVFFLFGNTLGNYMFSSPMAGKLILTLSFICPFLYLTGTLSSILHGLGKTALTFLFNILGLSLRLLFVFIFIPIYGITGYLWGLLISLLLVSILDLIALRKYIV